jgi:site-specific DNA-methyltransferase (adenine-specific)
MVLDPPAGVEFMGKDWDGTNERDPFVAWLTPIMREAWRVLKPGAHGLVWALPRTSHWTAWALESAGFEVLDVITHLFGQGFPKSLDASKALDKAGGVRPVGRRKASLGMARNDQWNALHTQLVMPAATSKAAKRWKGWGTRLKPASEHWLLVRKPLSEGSVPANLTAWGVGAINVGASRVQYEEGGSLASNPSLRGSIAGGNGGHVFPTEKARRFSTPAKGGRCPANLILDDVAGGLLDAQAADTSRFFYCSKPSRSEKEAGCSELEPWTPERLTKRKAGSAGLVMKHRNGKAKANPYAGTSGAEARRNHHPTVKAVRLMRYLARMVTPPGGTVLDPFAGSGSTGVAAVLEGFRFLGVELDARYAKIARARIEHALTDEVLKARTVP